MYVCINLLAHACPCSDHFMASMVSSMTKAHQLHCDANRKKTKKVQLLSIPIGMHHALTRPALHLCARLQAVEKGVDILMPDDKKAG